MPKDFDLNSQKWLALVFADKNKEYGAYVHREESSDRHLKALIIITAIALCAVFLPKLIKTMMPAQKDVSQTTMVDLSNIDINQEVPEENQIKEVIVPPPPELKTTVGFTELLVVADSEIKEEDVILTQQELAESTAAISIATVEGSETGTVDIQDLVDQKVIVEDKKDQVYEPTDVQVQPSFPGDLTKWLKDNIDYPSAASEQGLQGRTTLRFVVQPDGSVADVTVAGKGPHPACDAEAVRKVSKMPKWNPGKQNGNPVPVYFYLPVRFQLNEPR